MDVSINIIHSGTTINGLLKTKDSVKVEGTICGTVISEGNVIVEQTGLIDGNVQCKDFFVHGRITGEIDVNIAHVYIDAKIEGPLTCHRLILEPGARITKGLRFK